jgi:DNA polymerase III delta prime subunit
VIHDCYCYRIIEPLASRCAKFRFKPLSEEVMSSRIMHICNEEGLNLDAQVFKLALFVMSQMSYIIMTILGQLFRAFFCLIIT